MSSKKSSNLSPGDTVELTITAETKSNGKSMWFKVGATTKVRDGEDGDDALERIDEFVIDNLDAYVQAVK